MSRPLRVVVIVGSPVEPGHVLRSSFGDGSFAEAVSAATGRTASVALLSWLPALGLPAGIESALALADRRPARTDRVLRRLRAGPLTTRLSAFPAGRLANSFSPADQSRVFWRAVRAHRDAIRLIASADVVVAADLPAVKTAWNAVQHGGVPRAIYGLTAAVEELAG